MADRPLLGRVSRRLCTRWSGACGVLVEDVADGDWFVAVGAESAEVDALAGAVAVVAPLLAQLAGVAGGALVDGDVAAGGAGRHDDGRSGVGVAGVWGVGRPGGGGRVAVSVGMWSGTRGAGSGGPRSPRPAGSATAHPPA